MDLSRGHYLGTLEFHLPFLGEEPGVAFAYQSQGSLL